MNINILLCLNETFIFGAGTLIASINKYNSQHNITYHIFTPSEQLVRIKYELTSRISYINTTLLFYNYSDIPNFDKLKENLNERMAVQCVRIIAPRICRSSTNNLIYIDSDIICLGDISELAEKNLKEVPIAVVPDDPTFSNTVQVNDKVLKGYFCSGLIIFNLNNWLTSDLEYKCIDFATKYKPKFPDQDALNYVCNDQYTPLDKRYNVMWRMQQDTVFLHFINEKPWAPWCWHKDLSLVNTFRRHAKLFEPDVTKWISFKDSRKVLLNYAYHRKGTKWITIKLFSRHKFLASCYYYYRHLKIKLKQKGVIGIILFKSTTRT